MTAVLKAMIKPALAIVLGGALLIPAATASPQASGTAGTAAVAGEAAVAGVTHRVVLDCEHKARVRPGTYILACGDGNNYLASMTWSSWGASLARARGLDIANDCRPYCAAGHFHRFPVEVVLSRPRVWTGHSGVERFTRLTLTYGKSRPEGAPRQETYPLP